MHIFRQIRGVAVSVLLCLTLILPATAAELLIIEADDCPYCQRFHAEIGVAYPKTDEGKLAPLKILDISQPMPKAYEQVKPAVVTPTFILVQDNREVDRLVGYPGDEYFWFLLGQMLNKL
ncbi:MAG: thioredoxin family protein [Pseudomonadota bacterium]